MDEFTKTFEEIQIAISIAQIHAEEILQDTKKIRDKVQNLEIIHLVQKNENKK